MYQLVNKSLLWPRKFGGAYRIYRVAGEKSEASGHRRRINGKGKNYAEGEKRATLSSIARCKLLFFGGRRGCRCSFFFIDNIKKLHFENQHRIARNFRAWRWAVSQVGWNEELILRAFFHQL